MPKTFGTFLAALLAMATFGVHAQNISTYNPQLLYDGAGSLYDAELLREMHVTFEDANYHETLVDAFFNNPSLRIPATVELDGVVLDSVGTRYKGNSTFCLPNDEGSVKVPYNLDFNYWISGQDLLGYNKVKLANAWLDPTYCKEYAASRIYRKYLPTPEINLIKLYTQGDYTGLYVNTESINRQFLNKHFDENDGVLFKCDGAGVFCDENGDGTEGGIPNLRYLGPDTALYFDSYTIKSDNGWAELLNLIETLQFNPDQLDEVLNIDRVLWAMAANTVVSNLDTYNGYYVHNYYLYLDEEGRFQMIPWDLDNSFVGAIMGWSYWSPNDVYHFDPFFTGNGAAWDSRPLTEYLFGQPEHRQRYLAHIRTIMSESMGLDGIQQTVDGMQNLVSDAASEDTNSLFPMSFFSTNVNNAFWADWGFGGILSTVEARMDFLSSHAEINVSTPLLSDAYAGNGVLEVQALNAESVDLLWTNAPYAGGFEAVAMNDNGTGGDAIAGDGMYSVALPEDAEQGFMFYFRAGNGDGIRLLPERAEYEYFIYEGTVDVAEATGAVGTRGGDWVLTPNPATHVFTLDGCAEQVPVTVSDAQGRLVHAALWDGSPIDISGWERGMYFVQVTRNKSTRVERLIVR